MTDRRSRIALLAAFLAVAAWLPAAAQVAVEGAKGKAPPVMASIPPVHSLLSGVMAGVGRPALLVPGGRSPHDFALKPSGARALSQARAVFWIGPGLEGFLARPLQALARNAFSVPLAGAEGVETRPLAGGAGTDPHVWLDPVNAAAMVRMMVIVMANVDPDNLVGYRRNGAGVLAGLGALEAELHRTLRPVAAVPFLVFHDAYGYFIRRFGLASAGAVAVDGDRPPGARRLARLRRMIEERHIACVFTEPQFRPALAATLTEGTRARIAVLDPLGAGLEPGPGLYGALMRGLVESLVACLGRG
ncbi:MAG: zinc ABC transporter substrate-binding protein [Rhodospirillales bacterium]